MVLGRGLSRTRGPEVPPSPPFSLNGRVPRDTDRRLAEALWRIHRRPERPEAWIGGGNLPWNERSFAERMLREHLDESHGAASRRTDERLAQLDWLWEKLGLAPGSRVFDVTCGPGLYAVELARRGCSTLGVDFSPAAIAHARRLAVQRNVVDHCRFVESDVRRLEIEEPPFDAALFLYGQLAVFPRDEAARLLRQIGAHLAPGARLCVELLDPARVDKTQSTWWFTDDTGLWGDTPFLHLGERFWDEETRTSTERFHILHLETGEMEEIFLCDQSYTREEFATTLAHAGFSHVDFYDAWDGVGVYDAREWVVYVATK